MKTPYNCFIFIVLLSFVPGRMYDDAVESVCRHDSDICYKMYRRETTNWRQAYDQCLRMGEQLVVVDTETTQGYMKEIANMIPREAVPHAWISGRRSKNASWTDLKGESIQDVEEDDNNPGYCAVYSSDRKEIIGQACVARDGQLRYVCQFKSNSSGNCPNSTYPCHNECCVIPGKTAKTWSDANQSCQDEYKGSLAYHNLEEAIENPEEGPSHTTEDRQYWIGVVRHPWSWVTGENANETQRITYTRWQKQEGSGINETCIHLDLNQDGNWADKRCTEQSQYFICECKDCGTRKTTAVTSSPNVTPSSEPAEKDKLMYIYIGSAAAVLFAVILVAFAGWYSKRNTPERRRPEHTTTATQVYPDEPSTPTYLTFPPGTPTTAPETIPIGIDQQISTIEPNYVDRTSDLIPGAHTEAPRGDLTGFDSVRFAHLL